jgi:aminoglycoside phosphotransferase family enzyme/predicted kinase
MTTDAVPPDAVRADASLSEAGMAETHISVLFFVGDRAYKLKKPVQFPFADFSTRAARERACHREVALNRRLAPDVYLGVSDIIGPDGQPCDHLVVMRRMPDDRRLARLVRDHDPDVPAALEDVARQLAAFHASAERSPEIERSASPGAIAALWADNFAELHASTPSVLDPARVARAEALVDRFLSGRRALFVDRIAGGHVCDGHGDLQADDMFCFDDGVRILDCIEFSDELRYGDVTGDVAFLAMDLERLGAPERAHELIAHYERAAGTSLPRSLLDLSIAYRAQVRAKVACLRARQQPIGSPEWMASTDKARSLLELCLRHLDAATVRLVVVGGLPGTGKTTVASNLAEQLGGVALRSDVIRKELMGIDPTTPAGDDFGAGLYAPEITARVYRAMLDRASALLATGTTVVLDASFADAPHRLDARTLAADTTSELTELRCVLDPDAAAARIRDRAATGHDASDATPEIAAALAATFAPWPEAIELSTAPPPPAVVERALGLVRPDDR